MATNALHSENCSAFIAVTWSPEWHFVGIMLIEQYEALICIVQVALLFIELVTGSYADIFLARTCTPDIDSVE